MEGSPSPGGSGSATGSSAHLPRSHSPNDLPAGAAGGAGGIGIGGALRNTSGGGSGSVDGEWVHERTRQASTGSGLAPNIARYIAGQQQRNSASARAAAGNSGMPRSLELCLTPSDGRHISNLGGASLDETDAFLEASTCQASLHPADKLGRRQVQQAKNFLSGDGRVLVVYASGCIGMKPSTEVNKTQAREYVPSKRYIHQLFRETSKLHDPTESSARDEEFITPLSYYGKRVRYDLREIDPIMESSAMDMHDWVKLSNEITESYSQYDGFVILHGSDTMEYTAAALTFILEHIGKTVIFTGGVIPLCEPRTDALNNIIDAITIAGHFVIPEVCVYAHGKLIRATRARYKSATEFDMFDSPNAPLLGKVGVSVDLDWRSIRSPNTLSPLNPSTALCPDVSILHLFPGISSSAVQALLSPPLKGVVLRSFGSGSAPLVRHDLLTILKNATTAGIVIVNTTQCSEGTVSPEIMRALTCAGIVPGADMTAECALVKLSFLLGQYPGDIAKVTNLLGRDLRGELTVPIADRFNAGSDEFLSRLSSAMEVSTEGEGEELRDYLNNVVMCNAALTGDLDSIRTLVESGAGWQVDVQDYNARTPLHIAAELGHQSVAEYLILKGARVHHKDRHGYTPLVTAILAGQEETAVPIAKAGGQLGLASEKIAQLLIEAVVEKNVARIRLLVRHGADLSAADHNRLTPLAVAVQQGHVEVVKLILSTGTCDLAARDWWGYTVLEMAREASSRSTAPTCYVYDTIVDLLLQSAPDTGAFPSPACDMELTGDMIDT